MKKLITLLLALTMVLSLCACSGNTESAREEEVKILRALDEKLIDLNETDENYSYTTEYDELSRTYRVWVSLSKSKSEFSGSAWDAFENLTENAEDTDSIVKAVYDDIKQVMPGDTVKLVVIRDKDGDRVRYTGE